MAAAVIVAIDEDIAATGRAHFAEGDFLLVGGHAGQGADAGGAGCYRLIAGRCSVLDPTNTKSRSSPSPERRKNKR
jgi:hypothetical protein